MRMLKLLVVILTISGCGEKRVSTPLPLPPPLAKPTESSLVCLSDETYKIIVKMDKRIKRLENIIKSTHH